MKRRDSIRPDINKQYGGLCNSSTAISTYLFGDEFNKEVEELTKSNKLSNKVTTKPRSDYRAEPFKADFQSSHEAPRSSLREHFTMLNSQF
jgi:hypothetical protein